MSKYAQLTENTKCDPNIIIPFWQSLTAKPKREITMSEDDENLWLCLRQSRASSCVRTVLGFNARNKIKNSTDSQK